MIPLLQRWFYFAVCFTIAFLIGCLIGHVTSRSRFVSVVATERSDSSQYRDMTGRTFVGSLIDMEIYRQKPNVYDKCRHHKFNLLICVPVKRDMVNERKAIRQTWGSDFGEDGWTSNLVFFVGFGPRNEKEYVQKNLNKESDLYDDIVEGSYLDTYKNLTLKSLAIAEFASKFCSNSDFLLKADTDTYVNIPLLLSTLRNLTLVRNFKPFVIGYEHRDAHPQRQKTAKWYISKKSYNQSTYPTYVSGTAYAMTTSAAVAMFEVSPTVPLLPWEDIYITGLCAQKAGLDIIHDGRFRQLNYNHTKVNETVFVMVNYSPTQIRTIHKHLSNC